MYNKILRNSIFRTLVIFTIMIQFSVMKAEPSNFDTVLNEILDLGFPVISITTDNGELPTVEYVTPPEGSIGNGTINATKLPGKVERYEKNGTCSFSSGEYVKKESGMTLKIRGNSSAYREMKPYKIKLEKKGDLLNRGDKIYNDKNWALVAEMDWREWIGFNVASIVQRQWTPQCEFVNVILNGNYHGLYLLVETIECNDKCRVNISESGYLVEKDPYWWTEGEEFLISAWNPIYNYTFKYPDWEDLDDEKKRIIAQDLDSLIEILQNDDYENYIDIDSWVDFVLVHDFLGTKDSGGCNIYYTKYDDSSSTKIGMGPAWDFDTSSLAEIFSATHLYEHNYTNLFKNKNHAFVNAYIARYDEVRDEVNRIMRRMLTEGPCDPDLLNKNLEATDLVVKNYIRNHNYMLNHYFPWFELHKETLDNEVNKLRNMTSVNIVNPKDFKVGIESGGIKVTGLVPHSIITAFSCDGILIGKAEASEDGVAKIDLNGYTGLLIVNNGSKRIKIML